MTSKAKQEILILQEQLTKDWSEWVKYKTGKIDLEDIFAVPEPEKYPTVYRDYLNKVEQKARAARAKETIYINIRSLLDRLDGVRADTSTYTCAWR